MTEDSAYLERDLKDYKEWAKDAENGRLSYQKMMYEVGRKHVRD